MLRGRRLPDVELGFRLSHADTPAHGVVFRLLHRCVGGREVDAGSRRAVERSHKTWSAIVHLSPMLLAPSPSRKGEGWDGGFNTLELNGGVTENRPLGNRP